MRCIFYHGLEGNFMGSKPTALRRVFPHLEALDFQYHGNDPKITNISLDERIKMASDDLATRNEPAFLIGSSLGGLMAAVIANRYPELVEGYLLLAPAMYIDETSLITNVPRISAMVLGRSDSFAMNQQAEKFADSFGIPMLYVSDGHRLAGSLDWIVELAEFGYKQAMHA